jgi:hypothetical protein
MKSIVSIAALAGVALSKSNFEMTSFNVDTALEDKGVTVTSTPNIGANTYNPCYLAVSIYHETAMFMHANCFASAVR